MSMSGWKRALGAMLGLGIALGPAGAATIDLRECPLDRVTFIDPWAGGSFTVDRVGIDHVYRCGDDYVDEPVEGMACAQYGRTALEGDLLPRGDDTEPSRVLAVWYVEAANPCCGWSLAWPTASETAQYRWLEGDDVPLLGDMPFASIDPPSSEPLTFENGRVLEFGNEKNALVCETD